MKLIDKNALTYIWEKLKEKFTSKELKTGSTTEYKVLSDNNLTDELVTKINNAGDSSFTGNYEDLSNKPDLTVYAKSADVTEEINAAVANNVTEDELTNYVQYSDLVAITEEEIDEIFTS